ncbi:hypothetical protein ACTFIZ_004329 [Dictyostelium cf. discoideum]
MKNNVLLFILIFSLFLSINSLDTLLLESKQLISKTYSINSSNCTYEYLFVFEAFEFSSLSSSNPVSYYGGDSIVNNQVSIRVSNISIRVGSMDIYISIQTKANKTLPFYILLDESCSELPNNLQPKYYFDKWINIKSRLLKDPPKFTMYFEKLNGIGDPSNFLITGNLIKNTSTFYQREFETKILEFPYTYTTGINNIQTIEWYHFNSIGNIVESKVFSPPISQSPIASNMDYFPDYIYWDVHDNIFFTFNVTSTVDEYVLAGFNSSNINPKKSDAMNLYPIYGNPKNGQYLGFINNFNDYVNIETEWSINCYDLSNSIRTYHTVKRTLSSLKIPPTSNISNFGIFSRQYNTKDKTYYIGELNFPVKSSPVTKFYIEPFIFVEKVKFPFGFTNGNSFNYTYCFNNLVTQYVPTSNYQIILSSNANTNTGYPVYNSNTSKPIIQSFSFTHIEGMKAVLRVTIVDKYIGFSYATTSPSNVRITTSDLISGDQYNGTYEKLIDFSYCRPIASITTFNQLLLSSQTFVPLEHQFPSEVPLIKDITTFKFASSLVDLSTDGFMNTIYMNYSNANINYRAGFKLITTSEIARDFEWYHNYDYLEWDETLQLFKLDFYMPPRLFTGNLEYRFGFGYYDLDPNTLSTLLINTSINNNNPVLSVISNYADEMPPVVVDFTVPSLVTVNPYQTSVIIFLITVIDPINGIESINVTIVSDYDLIGETFTLFPPLSNNKNVIFSIEKKIDDGFCKNQTYRISEIVTRDTSGHYANSTFEASHQNILNPWAQYVSHFNSINCKVICQQDDDNIPPELSDFKLSKTTIDVGSMNRDLIVTFSVYDLDNRIFKKDSPTIYFTTSLFDQFSLKAVLFSCTNDNKNCTYNTPVKIPFMFGYPDPIIVSIYGIQDVLFNFNGFNSKQLLKMNFNPVIEIKTSKIPIIETNGSIITNQGGDNVLIGHWFGNNSSIVQLTIIYCNDTEIIKDFIYRTGSLIKFKTIKPTNYSINFQVSVDGISSSIYSILPIGASLGGNCIYVEPTNSPTNSPTGLPTNSPTNSPKNCLSNCGGNKQGYCNNGGCICYSPWIGSECSSKIIDDINPPIINNDTSTTTTTNNTNEIFSSLISIISLRELNYVGQVIQTYNLTDWIKINNSNYTSPTKFQFKNEILNPKTMNKTEINVYIEYFEKETNITFGDQEFKMMKSSIKYTIEIGSYDFSSKINNLQLVMSASFISSSLDDVCSNKEFGNSTDDYSNYLKIQVNDHSLYGRFIKYAIVDKRTTSIINEQLDSLMNPISTSNKQQSFIGITLPNYGNSIVIDPDFQLLLDIGTTAKNNHNSICNHNSKSHGLSSSQLTGIIIGSICFFAVIIISIIYTIFKKRKNIQFLNKLKKIEK